MKRIIMAAHTYRVVEPLTENDPVMVKAMREWFDHPEKYPWPFDNYFRGRKWKPEGFKTNDEMIEMREREKERRNSIRKSQEAA